METDRIENLLTQLLDEVRLLTYATKADSLERFAKDFLTSDLRMQMYSAFDGVRSLPEISKEIGCKINTLQVFAQTLIDNDLVDYSFRGNARIINKSTSKIATYYARKSLNERDKE